RALGAHAGEPRLDARPDRLVASWRATMKTRHAAVVVVPPRPTQRRQAVSSAGGASARARVGEGFSPGMALSFDGAESTCDAIANRAAVARQPPALAPRRLRRPIFDGSARTPASHGLRLGLLERHVSHRNLQGGRTAATMRSHGQRVRQPHLLTTEA